MAEITSTLTTTIEALLENKKYNTLKDIMITMKPADIAALLTELPESQLPIIFRLLPKELAAEAFIELDEEFEELLIQQFSDKELNEILNELYIDDTVDLIEEMPANIVKRIIAQSNSTNRRLINEMLKYPENSAGSIMTTELVNLHPEMTVGRAIEHIRKTGIDKETINICYVTSNSRKLIGNVSIRTLILSDEKSLIGDIMDSNIISVKTLQDREDVADIMAKYGDIALPVTDGEMRLVGIITVDDVLDVIREEATEDIEKMAAITPSAKPYLKLSVFSIYKSRIPWLLLLMISATFTGAIITHFQNALSSYLMLVAAIPMLMDTGGNCGSQSSVTIIRGMSLHEIEFGDLLKVMWKETRVSLLCGITLSAVNFVKLLLLDQLTVQVAAVICITLIFTVFAAKLIGCVLPILAKKLGFDPAVMASPFITTTVDALSLFIYFKTAGIILNI